MASTWVKVIAVSDILDAGTYFLGRPHMWSGGGEVISYSLYASPKNGPDQWLTKPGIAVRFSGVQIKDSLARLAGKFDPPLVAIEVPKDAATRWRRRR